MAQIFVSTFRAIEVVENQQSVELDNIYLVQQAIAINYDERDQNSIALDEGDTFQCGKCRRQFPFLEFINHKKNKCSANEIEGSVIQLYQINATNSENDHGVPIAESVVFSESTAAIRAGSEEVPQKDDVRPNETVKTGLKCSHCGRTFRKSYDLKQHVRIHTGERPFMCLVCGRAFKQKNNVDKHMDTHKVWPQTIDSLPPVETLKARKEMPGFVCQFCSENFVTHSAWKSHLKVHYDQKVYKCAQENCKETFTDREVFIGHCQNHQGHAKFLCHACSKVFRSLNELSLHQISHTNQSSRKLKCNKCEWVHLADESHSCRRHPCPLCHLSFVTPRFLRRHVVSVHGSVATSHQCNDCGKCFKSVKLLSAHAISHSTVKPHVCMVCSAAFKRREKLTRHRQIHDNPGKVKCVYFESQGCTKEFSRKDKMLGHLSRDHSDGK